MGNQEIFHGRTGISRISAIHYAKLIFRALLLIYAAVNYILVRVSGGRGFFYQSTLLKRFIWILFAVEMTLRFFPSSLESMGCQKQFARNHIPTGRELRGQERGVSRIWTALAWIGLNAAIGGAHIAGWLDKGLLLLISLAFSVCDMICILFFCPFQTWFLKNKCCGTCRIYNWDYAMMFTPLIFVGGLWSWSLLGLSLGLLLRWEITYLRHPERFYEKTNAALSCANCQEKLCQHKKSLRRFTAKQLRSIQRKEKD